MNMRWSLDELYTSFESIELKADMERFDQLIEAFKKWAVKNLKDNSKADRKIEEYLHMKASFYDLYIRLADFAELTLSVEAKNEKAAGLSEELDTKATELTEVEVNFQKWLGKLRNFEELGKKSKLIKEHQFYLEELMEENKYLLSDKEEVIIAKMINTGSNSWSKLQNVLTSTLLVDVNIDGKETQYPLPVVRNMAYSSDAQVRKKAYEAEIKA